MVCSGWNTTFAVRLSASQPSRSPPVAGRVLGTVDVSSGDDGVVAELDRPLPPHAATVTTSTSAVIRRGTLTAAEYVPHYRRQGGPVGGRDAAAQVAGL